MKRLLAIGRTDKNVIKCHEHAIPGPIRGETERADETDFRQAAGESEKEDTLACKRDYRM